MLLSTYFGSCCLLCIYYTNRKAKAENPFQWNTWGPGDGDDPFAKLDQQEEKAKEHEARKQQEDKHGDDDDDPFAKLDEQEEAEKERKTQQIVKNY